MTQWSLGTCLNQRSHLQHSTHCSILPCGVNNAGRNSDLSIIKECRSASTWNWRWHRSRVSQRSVWEATIIKQVPVRWQAFGPAQVDKHGLGNKTTWWLLLFPSSPYFGAPVLVHFLPLLQTPLESFMQKKGLPCSAFWRSQDTVVGSALARISDGWHQNKDRMYEERLVWHTGSWTRRRAGLTFYHGHWGANSGPLQVKQSLYICTPAPAPFSLR